MWQMITQKLTEAPPQPTLLPSSDAAGGSTADSDSVVWTYGGMLEKPEFDHYDSQLKFLVMWCLGKMCPLRKYFRGPLPGTVGLVELTDG